jgi:hypothetical protein
MSVSDFRSCERTPVWISRAIASSSRVSVSDAPSSVARREEKLFVSEINFNDGVEERVCADAFENLEFRDTYEGEISIRAF